LQQVLKRKNKTGYEKMIEIGRIVVKTAGRDAGKKGAVIDIVDDTFVIVDGQLRRKRCNIMHLEPMSEKISIEKNASHEAVVSELNKAGIKVEEKKSKKTAVAKPKQARKVNAPKPAVAKKKAPVKKEKAVKTAPAKKKEKTEKASSA
jgi:large subunit ribosomal protein L14e